MTFLQTSTPRKSLITAYLRPGNGGGTPGRLTSTERRRPPNNADEMVLNRGREERVVRPEGVEPPTYWFVASCSIQLSYGRTLRGMQLFKDNGDCGLGQPSLGGM